MSTTSQPCRIQAGAHKSTNGAGVLTCVRRIMAVSNTTNWLDYGCGVGGLVQFLRATTYRELSASSRGGASSDSSKKTSRTCKHRIRGPRRNIRCDHRDRGDRARVDPLGELRKMRALLKPGGNSVPDDRKRGTLPSQSLGLAIHHTRSPYLVLRTWNPGACLEQGGVRSPISRFRPGVDRPVPGEGAADPRHTTDQRHQQCRSVADPGQGVRSPAAAGPATDRRSECLGLPDSTHVPSPDGQRDASG